MSLVWIGLLGCYRPEAVPACALSCTSDVDCPQGNMCGSDQRCFPAGGQPCDQIDPPTDGPPIDGPCETFGRGLLRLCLAGPFDAEYSPMIDGEVINTDLAASCTHVVKQTGTNAPDLCVKAATTITINVTQTITGVRPLVLVAVDTLTIDTNGSLLSRPPPDMAGKYCPTANDGPDAGATRAGGGAGGSFGGLGGNGGANDGNVLAAATGTVAPSFVRGGCPGGRGGVRGAETRAPAGYGGGAIGLLARGTVAIAGSVDAAGGGGQGGATTAAGGGGGGSGGLIVVDAQNIQFKAIGYLLASGGGGGAGFGSSTGAAGETPGRYLPLGTGGVGTNGAGSGGNGSGIGLNGNAGNKSTTNDTGAGGGGGGAGWIRFYSEGSVIDGTAIYPPRQ